LLAIACIRRLALAPSRAAGQSQLAVLLLIVLLVMNASACTA
jgi:hypothetical protein